MYSGTYSISMEWSSPFGWIQNCVTYRQNGRHIFINLDERHSDSPIIKLWIGIFNRAKLRFYIWNLEKSPFEQSKIRVLGTHFGLFKFTIVVRNFGSSKFTIIGRNCGWYKITTAVCYFGSSKTMPMGRSFEWSKITIVGCSFDSQKLRLLIWVF